MVFVAWTLLATILLKNAVANEQYFLTTPTDTKVPENGTATLRCRIANQAGDAQWSKDGLLLGYDRDIPGFDRYTVTGDSTNGVHNLVVKNASLEDEGEYECQVSPVNDHPPITAKARLTVLLPATSIEIEGYSNNSKVAVDQSQSVSLICIVQGGKPAPQIQWRRNSVELSEELSEVLVTDKEDGRQTATSTLKLHPLPHDNRARYQCETKRLRLEDDPRTFFWSLKTRIRLDVRFPPGRPMIEGFREGDRVRGGDTLNLKCIARGGNPLAEVIWLKNGRIVDQSFISTDWESVNELIHVADPTDNGATYTCKATSSILDEPYEIHFTLTVFYAPSEVIIESPTEAKAGDVVKINCTTAKSNPPSELSWVVDGRPINSPNILTLEDKGGWTTRAEIVLNITQQERNMKLISCYAINQALGETVVAAATISILYAPDPPTIFGYTEGKAIIAATLQRLTCVSHGGNPLPVIKWFKGDTEITEVQTISNGNVISGEITVVAEASDNGARYECQSSSPAISSPLIANITLSVHFPPSSVFIKMKPKRPKANQKVTLTCETGSSNPLSRITWWRNGVQLKNSVSTEEMPSDYGGTLTKSSLIITTTSDDYDSTFTCKATNEDVKQSVHDAINLKVLYQPIFPMGDQMTADVKEDESYSLNISARGNPENITYIWLKNNETILEGPVLNISSAKWEDGGLYIVEATNDVGTSRIKLTLKVYYPASIVKDIDDTEPIYVIAEAESNIQMNCTADGHPLPEDVIKWQSNTFDMEKRSKTSSMPVKIGSGDRRRSFLTLINVTKEDSGEFSCVANNGIGDSATRKYTLLITHPPVVVVVEENSVVKSNRMVAAELQCKSEGVPDVGFTWSLEGRKIDESDRISQSVERLDHVTWLSKLTINDVSTKDFGPYMCVARNVVGYDRLNVTLDPNSAPDPPTAVRVLKATRESLQISWAPGFDGGHRQSFKLRFRHQDSPSSSYIDVHPSDSKTTWLRALEPNSTYDIAVMAMNKVGNSPYSSDRVKGTTLPWPEGLGDRDSRPGDGTFLDESVYQLLLSSAGVVLLCLLMLNIVLLFCYYSRKKTKKDKLSSQPSTVSDSYSRSSEYSLSGRMSEEVTLSEYSSSGSTPGIRLQTSTETTESHLESLGETSESQSDQESQDDEDSDDNDAETRRFGSQRSSAFPTGYFL